MKGTTQEIVDKMNNYLSEEIFRKLEVNIREVHESSLDLLNQFFIIVSKHYSGADYEKFGFSDTNTLRNEFSGLIVYRG